MKKRIRVICEFSVDPDEFEASKLSGSFEDIIIDHFRQTCGYVSALSETDDTSLIKIEDV